MTDRQLIEAYSARQDAHAFGVFVDRHQGALLSFAAAFLRDDGLAQDVVQETFMRAAQNPQRILKCSAGAASERNWLLKVTRDLSIDSLRKRATERRTVDKLATTPPENAPAADQRAEEQDEAACMHAAIERLDPRLRELLILKVREHKSYKEIAQIMGLSVTNVGFLLHQAMQRLAEELRARDERSAR